ncbi:MAG TPA: hypothetical protein VI389_06050 [Geobacteraceae bacterium]
MKIYLFNPETGVYLGEDFADEAPMMQGSRVIPPGATTITPPRVERGRILVFSVDEQRWEVRLSTETGLPDGCNSRKML